MKCKMACRTRPGAPALPAPSLLAAVVVGGDSAPLLSPTRAPSLALDPPLLPLAELAVDRDGLALRLGRRLGRGRGDKALAQGEDHQAEPVLQRETEPTSAARQAIARARGRVRDAQS